MARKLISVYADGSSCGDSKGAIGWGWLITDWDEIIAAGSAGAPEGTNNIAELQGAIYGLRVIVDKNLHRDADIELVSDSQYALNLGDGSNKAQKNLDLVKTLQDLFKVTGARSRWVRGHNGDIFNEKCDELAKHGRDQYAAPEQRKRRRSRKREERRRKRALVKAYKERVYGYRRKADPRQHR